jgi:heme exporter protein D
MHWSSWSHFISMGGYGLYVWGSYGVTLVLLGGEVLALLKRKRDLARRLRSSELETQSPRLETFSL